MPNPPLIPAPLAAARARAAIAYSGLEHEEVAQRSGLSVSVIRRITSKSHPRDGTLERLVAIAEACDGIPRWFMEHGWHPPAELLHPGHQAARLDAIEDEISLLLEAAGAQAPGGELGRRVRDALTNQRNRERHDFPEVPDSPEGNDGS